MSKYQTNMSSIFAMKSGPSIKFGKDASPSAIPATGSQYGLDGLVNILGQQRRAQLASINEKGDDSNIRNESYTIISDEAALRTL